MSKLLTYGRTQSTRRDKEARTRTRPMPRPIKNRNRWFASSW